MSSSPDEFEVHHRTISSDDTDFGGGRLEEEIVLTPEVRYGESLRSAVLMASAFAGVLFVLFVTLVLPEAIHSGAPGWAVLGAIPCVYLAAFLFPLLVLLPSSVAMMREWAPVRLVVSGDQAQMETREHVLRGLLSQCTWRITDGPFLDCSGGHWPLRPLILLETRLRYRPKPRTPEVWTTIHCVACGFTDESFEMWRSCFEAADIPRLPTRSLKTLIKRLLISAWTGGVLGIGIGAILEWAFQQNFLAADIGVVGIVDGLIVGFTWHVATNSLADDVLQLLTPGSWGANCLLGGLAVKTLAVQGVIWMVAGGFVNLALSFVYFRWMMTKLRRGDFGVGENWHDDEPVSLGQLDS